jgi:DNA-binding NtrC family response regulator
MKNIILLVDDENHVLSSLERALFDEPYEIMTAESGERGLELLAERPGIKVIISDERMPGMGGAEFLACVKETFPQIIRIMLTGHASLESTMKAVNRGEIYRFFTKPWDDADLVLALRSAVEKFDLEEENRRLLKTVKRQSGELRELENRFPGITAKGKDASGSYLLPELSDSEVQEIIAACCKEE